MSASAAVYRDRSEGLLECCERLQVEVDSLRSLLRSSQAQSEERLAALRILTRDQTDIEALRSSLTSAQASIDELQRAIKAMSVPAVAK